MLARPMVRRLAIAAAVVAVGVALWWLPTLDLLLAAVTWIRGAGALGFGVFLGVYLVGTLLMGPASWLQGAAGFLYGPWFGVPLAWAASNLSGLVAFRLARSTLREWVARRLARFPLHRAMDRAIGEDGLVLVVMLRLSPLSPFNPLCYALGLTRVRASRYALGTAIGTLAPATLYAFLGSTVSDLQELASGEAAQDAGWFTTAALALTLVASVAVTLFARRAVQKALAADHDDAAKVDVEAPVATVVGPSAS